jgi:biotin synthase
MESPDYVRTSLAAAITLGFVPGRFRREAKLTGLNLLLTYKDGCLGRCSYCGLAGNRQITWNETQTFIRVDWPAYPLEEIISRTRSLPAGQLKRVCVSMVTHRRAFSDMNLVIRRFCQEVYLPVSALISPTLIRQPLAMLAETKAAGADMAGIAIDAAGARLFEQHRGGGVHGPHRWDHYWRCVEAAVQVFGRDKVGVHLIVGLGETEREIIETIQMAQDMGAQTHLFSFFPEGGTLLHSRPQPSYGQYRRVQLARHIINEGHGRAEKMAFNAAGQVVDFGVQYVDEIIDDGLAFVTSGCPGEDGIVACNRPFGNERPSRPFRNYPFLPEVEDIALIRLQLQQDLKS